MMSENSSKQMGYTTKHDSATTFTHLPLELEDGKDSLKECSVTSIMM
jgi:hypothetical protein